MIFPKTTGISGKWVKGADVKSGTRCKLVSEAKLEPSNFEDGKNQIVAKIRFEDVPEVMNVRINNATANALVEAFGEDSKLWQGHYLTAVTEKMVVAGKRVTALYLVPEGFEVGEDLSGYVAIKKSGNHKADEINLEIPPDEVNEADIAF